MTTIGDYAFRKCISLNSFLVPSSVKYIRSHAFSSCMSLSEVYFTGKTKAEVQEMSNFSWGLKNGAQAVCIDGNLTIYNGNTLVKRQGSSLWDELEISGELKSTSITSKQTVTDVVLGNDVSSIGDSALYRSYLLSSMYIPSTVSSIGS